MLALFARSLRRHLTWWLASLWPGRHPGAPLGWKRLAILLFAYPCFLLLQLIHWVGFLCDELFFRAYREVNLQNPLFIIGIPRSGTTFLHRSLAAEHETFTSFSTWEAILAPSVTERKLVHVCAALDRVIGSPGLRILQAFLNRVSGDFNDIHAVALDAPEEDYLGLLPVGGCLILLLAFPFAPELRNLARLQQMKAGERQALLDFYFKLLQRHLYCHPDKRLLSKNAAFASWAGFLAEQLGTAKFMICLREPLDALSSQLSALAPARTLFATDPDGASTRELFTGIYDESYQVLAELLQHCPPERVAVLAQSDLKNDPAATILSALDQLGESDAAGHRLARMQRRQPARKSKHHHDPDEFSIDRGKIRDCMTPAYQTMLGSRHRSHP